jgi:ABC-2 type transport system permease protein
MEADELSLKDTQSIPADAGCLILYSPTVDMTVAEANLVKAYLNAGGTLILNTSPEAVETCPNIMSLGADFGLTALPGEVQEGNTAGFKGNPNLLLPAVSGMSASTDGSVTAYMPNAHGIATTTVAGVTANPLMTTTETAERVSLADKTTVLGEKGKVNVAAAAQKTVTGADGKSTTAHMVWFGSANAFTETAEKVNSEWNNQFYLYMAASACDSFVSSHSTIQAVSMTQPMLENLTVGWALILGLIFAIVIPAAVMGAGIVIWVARRRR